MEQIEETLAVLNTSKVWKSGVDFVVCVRDRDKTGSRVMSK